MQLSHLKQAQFGRRKGPVMIDLCCAGGRYRYGLGNPKVSAAVQKAMAQSPAYLLDKAAQEEAQEKLQQLTAQFIPLKKTYSYLLNAPETAWALLSELWGPVDLYCIREGYVALPGQVIGTIFNRPTLLNIDELTEVLSMPSDRKKVLLYSPVIDHSFLLTHADALPKFLAQCRELGVILVADERWSALGVTAKWMGSSHHPTQPDVYLLNEVVTDGLIPACLLVTQQPLKRSVLPAPLALAAFEALAAQLLQPNAAETILELEKSLRLYARKIHELQPDLAVQCIGYFMSVLVPDPQRVVSEMEKLGYVVTASQTRVAIVPPLTISKEQLAGGQEAFVRALQLA